MLSKEKELCEWAGEKRCKKEAEYVVSERGSNGTISLAFCKQHAKDFISHSVDEILGLELFLITNAESWRRKDS